MSLAPGCTCYSCEMQAQQLGSPVCLPMESLLWLLCCILVGKSAELKAKHLPRKRALEGQGPWAQSQDRHTRSDQIKRALWTQLSMLLELQCSEARLQGTVLAPTSQPARSPIPGNSSNNSRNIDMIAAYTCPIGSALKDTEQPSTQNGQEIRTSGMRARQDAS